MPEHRACRELFAPFALTIRQLSAVPRASIQLDPGWRMVAGFSHPRSSKSTTALRSPSRKARTQSTCSIRKPELQS